MEVLISIAISVLSGVCIEIIMHFIHKWLDRHNER